MEKLPSLRYTRLQKNKWLACASIHSMQQLLKLNPQAIATLQSSKTYQVFTIPKKNGKQRIIENPNEYLKTQQRKISTYLQAVYYFFRHPASYAFCMNVKNDNFPCNIYTHALRHTGCQFLLNADLKDFFHSITWQRLFDVFGTSPFIHDDTCIEWLCDLVTYNNRLPMGAPTSPVLSNLAASKMDEGMEALAKRNNCIYTRYADDLSFSSVVAFKHNFKEEVLQTIHEHGFVPNLEKLKLFGKKDVKIITGLQVDQKVRLSSSYWAKVDLLIQQSGALKCLQQNRPTVTVHHQLEDITKKLNGFLAFAEMIGENEVNKINEVKERMELIEEELEAFESLTWDDIPYQFF